MSDSVDFGVEQTGARGRGPVSRRTVMVGAAWAVPAIMVAAATPAYATQTSQTTMTGYPWSSWGVTWGSQTCGCSDGHGGKTNSYTWNIDNTSGSNLSYYGVRFYAKSKDALVGTYSGLINVYFLPFKTGSVNTYSTSGWSTLVYDPSYGTLVGNNGATYYAWVTTYNPSYNVTKGNGTIQGPDSINGTQYYWVKIPADYKFTITGTTTDALPNMYVTHEYYATLNGAKIVNSTSVNSNWTGPSVNFGGSPAGDASTGWRNNNWVDVPGANSPCQPTTPTNPTCWPDWNGCYPYQGGAKVCYNGHNFQLSNDCKTWNDKGTCSGSGGTGPGTSPGKDCGHWSSGSQYNYCDIVTWNNQRYQCTYYKCTNVTPGGRYDKGIWNCLGPVSGYHLRGESGAFVADATPTTATGAAPAAPGTTSVSETTGPVPPTDTTSSTSPTESTTPTSAAETTTSAAPTSDVEDPNLVPEFEEYATPEPVVDPTVDSGTQGGSLAGRMGIQSFSMLSAGLGDSVTTDSTTDTGPATPAPA